MDSTVYYVGEVHPHSRRYCFSIYNAGEFTPIVNHIVDVEMVLSTMGVKFTPIVDKITASKLHFFVFAMCYHTVF